MEVIYTPESALRHPAQLFRDMKRDLLASRGIAWRLMRRDLSAQYRQSMLGFLWAFLPSLAMGIAFTLANNARIINVARTEIPYTAYVILSTILWQTFVEALTAPVNAVTMAKPMLARINLPREAVVLAKLGEVFFNFAVKLVLVIAVFVWFRLEVGWSTLLAVFPLLALVLFGATIGLLCAPLGGLYEDVSKGIPVIAGLWLFLTPVIYPVTHGTTFSEIVRLNPVTPLLVTTRELATNTPLSYFAEFLIITALTLVGWLVAWIIYRLAMPFVVERAGS